MTMHKVPQPGDLLRLKQSSARDLANKLVRPMIFLLDGEAVNNITDDVYHHQLIAGKGSHVALSEGDVVMTIHFFNQPQYVRYTTPDPSKTVVTKTTKKYIASSPTTQSSNAILPKELKGYIAYVLFDEKVWATDVFSSLEEFNSSYSIIE